MDRNTSIGILFGVGIVVVLAFGLAMFPAQSEDTIILVNKNGNDPVNSCAPGNGLILAQNLTDLCDVVIVSPVSDEVLKYNGTFWTNQNESASDVTSVTSNSNSTIGVVPTTGNVVLYPQWIKACQTILVSSNASITCQNFTPYKHYLVSISIRATNNATNTGVVAINFNSDGGTNYSWRLSSNGGADVTSTSNTSCRLLSTANINVATRSDVELFFYDNLSTDRKGFTGVSIAGLDSSAGSTPNRHEYACKWDNTTNQINRISLSWVVGTGTPLFDTDTSITIWGYN